MLGGARGLVNRAGCGRAHRGPSCDGQGADVRCAMRLEAELLGDSPRMVALREKIRRLIALPAAAPRLPPLLLEGETGTGKGLVASVIHRASPRRHGPFVDVNCAAIPENLLEAEMFGYERGAFTDARHAKEGLFQAAHGGTIFLDEVALLSEALQAKLLKVLEERTVRRLGSTRSEPTDAWVIAATNEDLAGATRARRFREDLYHRLAVVSVALPALRLSGLYLALVTLAFAQFTQWLMLNWERVTFGAGGFKVPPLTFGSLQPALGLYYLSLLLCGLLVAGAWNTVRSGIGRALVAVRDSEVAAEALAIDLARYKAIAFSLSALYAGVAGGLYSAILSFVAPEGFDLFQMVVQFSMVVVGGLGSVWGSVLGAGLLVGLQEALRAFKGGQEIAFGLVLMGCIVFLPDGIISLVKRRARGWEEPLRAPDRRT